MALSDILAQLFGTNNAATPPAAPQGAPAPQGQPPVAPLGANPTNAAFIQSLLNSANAHINSQTPGVDRSLGDYFTGNDRKAAAADINGAGGQSAWQLFQQAQSKTQSDQSAAQNAALGTMENYAQPQAMTGTAIDPTNPMASVNAYASAMRQYLTNGFGSGAPQGAPATPAGGPAAPPQAPPAPQQSAQAGPAQLPTASDVGGYITRNIPGAIITSGARTPQQNAAVGGVPDSMHLNDNAVDFVMPKGTTFPQVQDMIAKSGLQPTEMLNEGNHVHIGWGPKPGQPAPAANPAAQQMNQNAAAPPQGQAAPQAGGDQNAFLRRLIGNQLTMKAFEGDTQGVKALSDVLNVGRPDNTVVSSGSGNFVPAQVQTPNGPVSSQAYGAQGAGMTSAATLAGTNSQTPVQVVGRNGPMTITQAQVLQGGGQQNGVDGKPNWLQADSPQYKVIQSSQQDEIKTARSDAQNANTGLDTATELYNAANHLFTGKGGEVAQSIRKTLQSVSMLTSVPVPKSIADSTSQFEQLKYAALNFVQSAAHGFSPRAAVQVVKLIQAAKPGDTTSPQGLQAIIKNQVIPAFLRARAMYGATEDYYQKNPLATDAQDKIPNELPITSFGVKDRNHAQPGDYYTDPNSGNLRQRPMS